jgi:hypothetical protein
MDGVDRAAAGRKPARENDGGDNRKREIVGPVRRRNRIS